LEFAISFTNIFAALRLKNAAEAKYHLQKSYDILLDSNEKKIPHLDFN